MTTWYNEVIDPAGYGYGGYGEGPYGGEATAWTNISDPATTWANDEPSESSTWGNVTL